jgi:hypothetical protein
MEINDFESDKEITELQERVRGQIKELTDLLLQLLVLLD